MARVRHAEIAGAGLGGLTLAAALAQSGWSVRVHERAPHLRDLGVGTSIWENGHRALDAVGALTDVMAAGTRIEYAELRDHHQRAVRIQKFHATDDRGLVVLRVDHHRALVKVAQDAGVEIVTSSPVAAADPKGVLILESGERLPADLVVGCDGFRSKVRDSLGLAKEVGFVTEAFTGRVTVPRDVRPGAEVTKNYWAGHRRCGLLGCGDVNYIYVCAPEDCPHNPEEVRTRSLNKDVWIEAFPHLEDELSKVQTEVIWNRYTIAVCHAWSAGRAAILGDSAHAMPPLLAQGAGCAMANAIALSEALRNNADVPSALQAWERRERPITDITQRWAILLLVMAKRWPLNLLDMRSDIMDAAFSSPGLLDHYYSAANHIVQPYDTVPTMAATA
jgi:2-polyprenyl-6-methoxyphenol hydroxylase-like FAD-dependent oxidoreductase